MSSTAPTGIEIFYSYSHKDERLRNELETHLAALKRQGLIRAWHDREIGAGTEWAKEIDAHLNSAHVILLFISANFLASDYCYSREMGRALERHEAGEARVIPIILKPCDWHVTPFGKLQALPRDGKPVTKWSNRDEALTDVALGIRRAVEEVVQQSPSPPPPVEVKSSVSTKTQTPVTKSEAATPAPAPSVEKSSRPSSATPVRTSPSRSSIPVPEMVAVPGEPFRRGTSDEDIAWLVKHTDWAKEWRDKGYFQDEQPSQVIEVPAFEIGRYPVTNREYQAFVEAADYSPPTHWEGKTVPKNLTEHPVVNVNFRDALAYCQWLSQTTGRAFRLPTETEWEKAARGTDGRQYPWGNEFDRARCNTLEAGLGATTPVGQYSPRGDSPYGCMDMAGNVWEWCCTKWETKYNSPTYGDNDPQGDAIRVVRGGSWFNDQWFARCACRYGGDPYLRANGLGFRVVLSPPTE